MTAKPRRPDRVAESIRESVATFLMEGVKDPRISGLVTVTGVEVTRDLRHARIFVSIMGSDDEKRETMEGLGSVAGHLRARLSRSMRLRVAPELEFRYDRSVERAARIEALLEQVRSDQPDVTPDAGTGD